MPEFQIINSDCIAAMKEMADNSADAIVTDPPYELGFMGKSWDSTGIANNVDMWKECLRVLKPGGHLLAFSGTRTYHRMASAIEDAGFEIRDMIAWVYGSGFPKSLNIGKAVDKISPRLGQFDRFAKHLTEQIKKSGKSQKEVASLFPSRTGGLTGCVWNWANGANVPTVAQWNVLKPLLDLSDEFLPLIERIEREREVIGRGKAGLTAGTIANFAGEKEFDLTKGTSDWEGWGTALKPAHEPICMARKPLSEKTVAENCLKWGVGGLNIDGCRISVGDEKFSTPQSDPSKRTGEVGSDLGISHASVEKFQESQRESIARTMSMGRFPANLVLSHSEGCRCVGTKKVKSGVAVRENSGGNTFGGEKEKPPMENMSYADSDGMEKVEAWECAEGCPIRLMDEQSGISYTKRTNNPSNCSGNTWGGTIQTNRGARGHTDSGGASRFFANFEPEYDPFLYCAKASKQDRNEGCEEVTTWEREGLNDQIQSGLSQIKDMLETIIPPLEDCEWNTMLFGKNTTALFPKDLMFTIETATKLITELKISNFSQNLTTKDSILDAIKAMTDCGLSPAKSVESISLLMPSFTNERAASALGVVVALLKTLAEINGSAKKGNVHNTVKPVSLMRWLCKLITPPGGTCLDPFMGSGSTGKACMLEGFNFIGIEQDAEYCKIAEARIRYAQNNAGKEPEKKKPAPRKPPTTPKAPEQPEPEKPAPKPSAQVSIFEIDKS